MIYTDTELKEKIREMVRDFESEVVEFKEANNNYSFKDIGKYFSALGNEANIRGKSEGWLIFGITNKGEFKGTDYRKNGNLQSLKKEIANNTNERMTFLDIYEITMEKCRIVAFQIPPAMPGIPTTWNGAAWAREHESLVPLPMNKVDLIRSQVGLDWSKEIIKEATIDDLDPEAVAYARKMFSQKQENRKQSKEILSGLSDIEVLNKAGICFKGKITRTALLLLGKKESAFYFDGFIPRITWTLYNADKTVKAYEHFDMPLLLAVDKVYAKIRNENYRYIAEQQTLFPEEVQQYDADLVKEVINNCIAHSDYRRHGKINVEEFEDHLVFINEGAFIPETVEKALEPGYKPPYYRNAFLCNAMVNMYMIDTNSMGIPMIYNIQKARCFPLPTYDLDVVNQVQKRKTISKDDYKVLKKSGLVEGRYPALYVSYKIAEAVGDKAGYVRNKGLDEKILKELIISALQNGPLKKADIYEAMKHAFPDVLTEEKQYKKLSNLLQQMKRDGIVGVRGYAVHAEWFLVETV